MDAAELRRQIEVLRFVGSDTQHIEVKSARGGFPSAVLESICAFANDGGGTVILGLNEKEGFTPVEIDARTLADSMKSQCESAFNIPLRPRIDLLPFEAHTLVVAEIDALMPKEKPCYIKKSGEYQGAYIRTADGDHRLTHYEVDRLRENRTPQRWDAEPVEGATLADLDADLVDAMLRVERSNHPRIFAGSKVSVLRMLRVLAPAAPGILADDEASAVPTLAGLLALGRYPQYFFPQLSVTCVAYAGTDRAGSGSARFLDNALLVGPIPQMVADAVAFVAKNMRIGATINEGVRRDLPDYPLDVVREAVTNALMHRDYSPDARGAQVQVNLFVDRLEVQSPGGLYGTVTLERLAQDGISDSRNQFLANLLEKTPYDHSGKVAENRGSGYQTMLHELAAAKMPLPEPRDTLNFFRITFPRSLQGQGEKFAAAGKPSRIVMLEYLAGVHTASTRELAAAAGISVGGARRVVGELLDAGVIERTEPSRSPKQRYRLAGNS